MCFDPLISYYRNFSLPLRLPKIFLDFVFFKDLQFRPLNIIAINNNNISSLSMVCIKQKQKFIWKLKITYLLLFKLYFS